jgi:hypothetical protein
MKEIVKKVIKQFPETLICFTSCLNILVLSYNAAQLMLFEIKQFISFVKFSIDLYYIFIHYELAFVIDSS